VWARRSGVLLAGLLAGIFFLLTVFGVPLAAQDNPDANPDANEVADSQLAGVVRAADGTPIPGSTLRVTQISTGKAWITWTNESGGYEFPALPEGHYRVEVSQLGFTPATQEIDLTAGSKSLLDLKMDVGTLTAITAPPAKDTAAPPSALPPGESAKAAPSAPASGSAGVPAPPNPSVAANNSGPPPRSGRNGGGGSRGAGGGRNGQGAAATGSGGAAATGGRAAFQQLGLNGLNQNGGENGTEDQNLTEATSQLGQQASSADAVQMIGTVAMALVPAGGFPQPGDMGPGGPGGFGIPGFGGPGGGPMGGAMGGPMGGPGPGGFGGGPRGGPIFVQRGGGGRGRGPQGGPEGPEALWGAERVRKLLANRVHFSFYNTFGDSALNARPYSLYEANPQKISSWTETAGLNIGGPLKIPHVYNGTDKTFFFINFSGTWARTPVDSFATVPTDFPTGTGERNGFFSNVMVYDPATGLPFSGCPQNCSILPANPANFTPQEKIAQGLLNYIPKPNIPVTMIGGQNFNYHLQTNVPGVSNRLNVNVTHQISSKLSLQVNYNLSDATSHSVNSFPGIEGNTFTRGQSAMIGLTQNWTKTFLHTSQFYFSRNRSLGLNEFSNLTNVSADLGISGISTLPNGYGLPLINFTNFTGLNDPNFSLDRSQTYRYVDSLRWMKTKHTISVGGEIRKMDINRDTDPAPNGQFAFTGQLTSFNPSNGSCDPSQPGIPCGNDFADFLLGYPANTKVQYGDTATYFRNWGFIAYASDDWHMVPRFTLTYGVRYEAFTPPTEINDHIANLTVSSNFSQVQCVTPVPNANGSNCSVGATASLFNGHYNNWAPRLGISWQPPGKWFSGQHQMTVRAGFSMFYIQSYLNTLSNEMANQPPFATANTLTQQTVPSPPLSFQTDLSQSTPSTLTNTIAVDSNYKVPYAMIWNFGIEYNLAKNTFLEVMYTGTRGVHLDELLGFSRATNTTQNVAGFTYDTSGAFSNMNALQVRLQKRMSHGIMFIARYTYSKSLDDASTIGGGGQTVIQNNADPHADYGLSSFDTRHQFFGMFSYQLPFGERQRFATKGWKKNVFGAWRLNGMFNAHSGTPYTVRVFSKNPSCQNVPGTNSQRADQNGNPVLSNPTVQEWFNTAEFRIPTGCFGDAPRNSVIGPGFFTINSGLTKTVQFGRDGLRRLDFSWNAANLLNHPNFTGLSTVLGSKTFGQITSVGAMRTMTFTTRFNF
jgi:carboxypeptidase family protein